MSDPVFHITPTALEAADEDPAIAVAFAMLMSSINTDHRRDPSGGWQPNFPESLNRPDMWIVTVGNRQLWAMSDTHQPVTISYGQPEPCQPGDRCGLCGRAHVEDLEVVTLMLPEDGKASMMTAPEMDWG